MTNEVAKNIETMRQWYATFENPDTADSEITARARFSMLDPDVEWTIPQGHPRRLGRTYYGTESLTKDFWTKLNEYFDKWGLRLDEYFADGDKVISRGLYFVRARASGVERTIPFVHAWQLRKGKIVRLQQYTDTALLTEVLSE